MLQETLLSITQRQRSYKMVITSAKYINGPEGLENTAIEIVVNNMPMSVPLNPANSDYAEIMRQVNAGELTIADAD